MEFFQPATWSEALAMKAAHPEAMPIVGGTDVMVELNLDHRRPEAIIDLTRISDVRSRIPALNHRKPVPEPVSQ